MDSRLTENSGTTFLRIGGEVKVQIKSNTNWKFGLYNLLDGYDIHSVRAETYIDDEGIEQIRFIGVDTSSTPDWINVLDSYGVKNKSITGSNTDILTIVADENLTKQDQYCIGIVKSTTYSYMGGFTAFLSYGESLQTIKFDKVEGNIVVHTPSQVQFISGETLSFNYLSNTYTVTGATASTYDTTVIPFEIYTSTPCNVSMEGAIETYVVNKGSTTNSGKTVTTDCTNIGENGIRYYFKVPTNKSINDVNYVIRAVSREDNTVSEEYVVTFKGMASEIILSAPKTELTAEDKQFVVNYSGMPATMVFNLNVHEGYANSYEEVMNLPIVYTLPSCNGVGSLSYQTNENESLEGRTFYIEGSSMENPNIKAHAKNNIGLYYITIGQSSTPVRSIEIYGPQNISETDSSFVISYSGVPSDFNFKLYVWEAGHETSATAYNVTGEGTKTYNCGSNTATTERVFYASASTVDEQVQSNTVIITQNGVTPIVRYFRFTANNSSAYTPSTFAAVTASTNYAYQTNYENLTVSNTNNWITGVTLSSNNVNINILENFDISSRSGSVNIYSNSTLIGVLNISQNGAEPRFVFTANNSTAYTPSTYTSAGTNTSVAYETNIPGLTIQNDNNWIIGATLNNGTLSYSVGENSAGSSARSGSMYVKSGSTTIGILTLNQAAGAVITRTVTVEFPDVINAEISGIRPAQEGTSAVISIDGMYWNCDDLQQGMVQFFSNSSRSVVFEAATGATSKQFIFNFEPGNGGDGQITGKIWLSEINSHFDSERGTGDQPFNVNIPAGSNRVELYSSNPNVIITYV